MGSSSNRASWTGSLQVFILSQETVRDPDPWTPSLPEESRPPGRALTSGIRRWIWTPGFCASSLQKESLPAESVLTPGRQGRVGLPGMLTESKESQEE